jgi:hypothetical protein
MPSKVLVAKVLVADMRRGTCVKAVEVSYAKPSNAAAAKAADVTTTEATDVASAKATHVTSTKAAHVASTAHTSTAHAAAVAAAATTASGLCARGKQASGQHYACQGHYHSPFHDILHSNSADFPPRVRIRAWRVECQARDRVEVRMLSRLLY